MEIFADDLDEFETAKAANIYYLNQIRALATSSITERINFQLIEIFNNLLTKYKEITTWQKLFPSGFDLSKDVYVIAGECKGEVFLKKYRCSYLIVVDRNAFLSLVLTTFYFDSADLYSEYLLPFLFLHFVADKTTPFPFLDDLFEFELKGSDTLITRLMTVIGEFIIFHELGHMFQDFYQSEQLTNIRIASKETLDSLNSSYICRIQLNKGRAIFQVYDNPETLEYYILYPEQYRFEVEEFTSDIFAMYTKLLTFNSGKIIGLNLERLVFALCVWQIPAYMLLWKESYQAKSQKVLTHPNFLLRMDIMILHIEVMARKIDKNWTSPAITILRRQYDQISNDELWQSVADGLQYVFFTIDGTGPKIDVGNVFSFADIPVPVTDGVFTYLGDECISKMIALTKDGASRESIKVEWSKMMIEYSRHALNDQPVIGPIGLNFKKLNLKFFK